MYGLLIAAEPSAWTGYYVDTVVALDGSPSGAYRISHVDDDIVVEGAADGEHLSAERCSPYWTASRDAVFEKVLDGPAGLVQQLGLLRAVAT